MGKIHISVAYEVIFGLDLAQEERELTADERRPRAYLKSKLLGIAAIDRVRWRQRSHISWIKEGDANTIFLFVCQRATAIKPHTHANRASGTCLGA